MRGAAGREAVAVVLRLPHTVALRAQQHLGPAEKGILPVALDAVDMLLLPMQ